MDGCQYMDTLGQVFFSRQAEISALEYQLGMVKWWRIGTWFWLHLLLVLQKKSMQVLEAELVRSHWKLGIYVTVVTGGSGETRATSVKILRELRESNGGKVVILDSYGHRLESLSNLLGVGQWDLAEKYLKHELFY